MNLEEWINTPDGLNAYVKWRNDTTTRRVLAGIAQKHRAAVMANPSGEAALQELGRLAGRDEMINDFINLDNLVKDDVVPTEDLTIVSGLVSEYGYSKSDVMKHLKKGKNDV